MVAAETFPAVEAKYERVQRLGRRSKDGWFCRKSCEVSPLHSLTTSLALIVGGTRTNRWMWSGWIASSRISQPRSKHLRSINERHSIATAFTRTGLRRLGVQTKW